VPTEFEIAVVDRGRGPQLSTSRITVQDLLPYFQFGYTHDQIIRDVMPSLSIAEIETAKRYVDEHRDDVLEVDRRIRERNATHKNSPEVEEILRRGRQKALERLQAFHNHRGEGTNGEGCFGVR
jgi:uncharacterized protein (DUF433 family)